jgi:hypothetical protein
MSIFFHQSGRILVGATLAVVLSSFLVLARAETWPLKLKKLSKPDDAAVEESFLYYYGNSDQSFQAQVGPAGKDRIEWPGMAEQAAAFKRIVKKEPAYKSDYPFRGVAELGGKKFAFALDAVPPDPKAEKATPDPKPEKKSDASPPAKEEGKSEGEEPKTPPKKILGYNRLYFDFNGNGDLTDEEAFCAEPAAQSEEEGNPWAEGWATYQFPRMMVALDSEGTKFEFACNISGYLRQDEELRYASASLSATDYREGEITLDGKKLRVVLFDANCNGRFDDAASIAASGGPNEPLGFVEGDTLIFKPVAEKEPDVTRADLIRKYYDGCRHRICKLVEIDGHYYAMKIPPAGDKISLEAVTVETGSITNPNDGFSAVIYGDQGILKISGDKDKPVAVPVGKWKLLSYKIDRTKIEEAEKKAEKPEQKADAPKQSILQAFGKSLLGVGSGMALPVQTRETYVEAEATSAYKEVEVRKGETVALPFGPPYKPTVSAGYFDEEKKTVRLSLSLVGSAGEVCSDLEVKGGRPSKPEFSITDPQGKVVVKGAFEYG